jgi:hypothetical protein
MKSGEHFARQDHLAALEKEAEGKGFILIARRSKALRKLQVCSVLLVASQPIEILRTAGPYELGVGWAYSWRGL